MKDIESTEAVGNGGISARRGRVERVALSTYMRDIALDYPAWRTLMQSGRQSCSLAL